MSIKNYFKLLLMGGILLFQYQELVAQNELPPITEESSNSIHYPSSSTYLGARGGYFLKNKSLSIAPQWQLNNGFHIELNGGYKKGIFGWSGALGYLNLSRSTEQVNHFNLNTNRIYNTPIGNNITQPLEVISGLDQNHLSIASSQSLDHQPLRGFYLLTGPNLWVGEGRWKGMLAIEGGVGMNQIGYFQQSGSAANADGVVEIQVAGGAGIGPDYEMTAQDVVYTHYSMSKKYSDLVQNSTLNNPLDEKEPYELLFIGRANAQVEYFLQPNLSLHVGGSYWYMVSPEMSSIESVSGYAQYLDVKTGRNLGHDFEYQNVYDQKNISLFSGNIGLKYWLGNKNKSKKSSGGSASKEDQLRRRVGDQTIVVNVIDQLTKTPIEGVNVRLMNTKTREVVEVKTQPNGVATLSNIIISDYELTGNIYGVETSSEIITTRELDEQEGILYKTLYYNDRRFILKGVTLNTDDQKVVSGVLVSLESGSAKISQMISEEDGSFTFLLDPETAYQVQGLKDGLYSSIEKVTTQSLNRSQQLYVQLHLGVSPVRVGLSFVIENILYDFDSDVIRYDAGIELDRLTAFLNTNPNIKIELSSHTDSRGDNNYNMKLSQKRAQSAVNFLIGKGIAASRLSAKGYGETKLLNQCKDGITCSEEEHQLNRRTEIKIME